MKKSNIFKQFFRVRLQNDLSLKKIYYDFCVTAIEQGAENVFKFFVERQKKFVNYEPRNGWTLLHVAAYYKRSSMMLYLLQQGASIKSRSAMLGGLSCVHIAIGRGDVNTVKLLGDMFKLDFNNYLAEETIGFGPRMCSAPLDIGVGHLPMIQYLLECGVVYKPSSGRWDAIQAAVAGGNLTVLQFLVEKFGINLASHDATVKACLISEPHITTRCGFPDFAAEDHLECFDYDESGEPPRDAVEVTYSLISLAATHQRPGMVEYLIKNGAPYDLPDNLGNLPLHKACQYGRLEIARIFIEKLKIPIDSLTANEYKESYLYTAARNLQPRVAQYLVEKKPHLLHLRDGKGCTPLRSAIEADPSECEEDFIDTIILLFDSKEFTQDDFAKVFLDDNQNFCRENRFDLITCILANSSSVEEGYNNLMQQLKIPVTNRKPRDDLPEEEKAITRAKQGLQALAESHKFFAQRANIPLRLAFGKVQRIEKAASDVHDVAETCHEINFFSARLCSSDLVNHILSFLTGELKSETGLNIPPLSLAKTVRFFPREMNKMERARLIDRVTQLIPIQSLPKENGRKRSKPT